MSSINMTLCWELFFERVQGEAEKIEIQKFHTMIFFKNNHHFNSTKQSNFILKYKDLNGMEHETIWKI